MIIRTSYLNNFKNYIDLDVVKVITGMRRSGKSYFMKQVIDFLRKHKQVKKDNIVYINKEDLEFDFMNNYLDIDKYVQKKFHGIDGKKYLFIDEVQDVDQREKAIRSYAAKKDYDIYITGSNSNLLSSELSTYLTGRYIEFHMYPLTFKEFLEFRGDSVKNTSTEFDNYLKYGGLPALHQTNFTDEIVFQYIGGVFNSILFKDIVSRYQIRNAAVFQDIFKYLSDNIGNIVSSKKISDYLKNEKITVGLDGLREYLEYFQNAFLLHKAHRYDIKGKKLLDLLEKYYLGDLGFRSYLLGYKRGDIGQLLENIVYLELKARGYDVKIGKVGELEIDFIAKKDGSVEYYQVCYILADENTVQREFGVLQKVQDNYPKYVLSMDELFDANFEGIQRINIIERLLNK